MQQYLETEKREVDAIIHNRFERDEKERQMDLELFEERREGSNWLENREMRMETITLESHRALITTRIEIRKRLGLECPELMSNAQLSQLEETMLRTVQLERIAQREDYQRRAHAAGVPMLRSEQRDAAAYGELEALIRRDVRQLSLALSLGRLGGKKPSRLRAIFKAGSEWEPLIKLLGAILAFAGAAITLYLRFHKGP